MIFMNGYSLLTQNQILKMLFIKANNLSGAFLWTIDLDDFRGDRCGEGSYPLLTAIKNELLQPNEVYDVYDSSYSYANRATFATLLFYCFYYTFFVCLFFIFEIFI
jgi:hypothetical protein